jgi:thiamine-phosphate diphosphorylase
MLNSTHSNSSLPFLYLITPNPEEKNAFDDFIRQLENSLASGIRLVQLRAKNLDRSSYQDLAKQALASCRKYEARLILNAPPEQATELDADGVHLDSARLMACAERPLSQHKLVAASCHNSEQLEQAKRIHADFVTLSPVLKTRSHPEASPLGWERFTELSALTDTPIYALGGILPEMLPDAQACGAYGVAAIRSLWQAEPTN